MANKFCIISLIVLFHINVIYLTLLASIMIVYYTDVYNKTSDLTCSSSASAKLMIQSFKSCHSALDCDQNFTKGVCLNENSGEAKNE
ncbi:hypothetical protein BpHYR1_013408 [Brachionus plicatilis]|uniref:Uncharacterized protein n=1 Tax=Brachionus plicatilis TaxID=10195 RepID=A0A3M7Q832_BRAPC|nr:hypothetical protein BpHYR1_013408 [Brachionus plicatilis]